MRTAANAIQELYLYLRGEGFDVYVDTRDDDVLPDGNSNRFKPYIVITSSPTTLTRNNMRLAGNENATRSMYIVITAVGNKTSDGTDDAGELLEQVNGLIEFKWAPTDGDVIRPAASYGYDGANTNTQRPRVYRTQRYYLLKNIRQP